MLCGIDNIPYNIPHIRSKYGNIMECFVRTLSVSHNNVMDMNNVMISLPNCVNY